jgi:hypothetical protein
MIYTLFSKEISPEESCILITGCFQNKLKSTDLRLSNLQTTHYDK